MSIYDSLTHVGWWYGQANNKSLFTYAAADCAWDCYEHEGGVKQSRFSDPANTLYFMDSSSGYPSYIHPACWSTLLNPAINPGWTCDAYPDAQPTTEWWNIMGPSMRHNGGFNAGWVDGHAKWCDPGTYYDCGNPASCAYWFN